jgi:hypothetical protein
MMKGAVEHPEGFKTIFANDLVVTGDVASNPLGKTLSITAIDATTIMSSLITV